MWILITAVVTASLLGSMHCVGMCGPLAIWASGAGDQVPKGRVALATSMYHIGRLLTYTLAGIVAGTVGNLVEIGGETLGLQLAAARLVGSAMILIGVWKLFSMIKTRWASNASGAEASSSPTPSRIGMLLVKLRPLIFRLPLTARALAVGLLTTLLPCGWLYLFALVAAGTGSPVMGGVTMAAFWLGTVPALTALIAGTRSLSSRFVRFVPAAAAATLIVAGGFTASGRGFAKLNSLADIRAVSTVNLQASESSDQTPQACCCDPAAQTCQCEQPSPVGDSISAQLKELTSTPLPCCVNHASGDDPSAAMQDGGNTAKQSN